MLIDLNIFRNNNHWSKEVDTTGVYYYNSYNPEIFIQAYSYNPVINQYPDNFNSRKANEPFVSSYGVCDNYKQALKYLKPLYNNQNLYVLILTPVYKSEQPQYGGWRWHKWGPYIGEYEIKYEYLYDEDIDMIFVFHLLQIAEPTKLQGFNPTRKLATMTKPKGRWRNVGKTFDYVYRGIPLKQKLPKYDNEYHIHRKHTLPKKVKLTTNNKWIKTIIKI